MRTNLVGDSPNAIARMDLDLGSVAPAAPSRAPVDVDAFMRANHQTKVDWRKQQKPMDQQIGPPIDAGLAGYAAQQLIEGLYGPAQNAGEQAAYNAMIGQAASLIASGQMSKAVDDAVRSPVFKARATTMTPQQLSNNLYTSILGGPPDPGGNVATLAATYRGDLSQRVYDMFTSPEYAQLINTGTTARLPLSQSYANGQPVRYAPQATMSLDQVPPEPGPALSTLNWREIYQNSRPGDVIRTQVSRTNQDEAILAAATAVRNQRADLFNFSGLTDKEVRANQMRSMTLVIGILRANGYDAFRTVNHPTFAMDDPFRYGSDALVLNGRVYDVYESSKKPVVQNVGASTYTERA